MDQGDSLTNVVPEIRGNQIPSTQIRNSLANTTVIGQGTDDTSAGVAIPYGVQSKVVYAINGTTLPAGGFYQPQAFQAGDRITFKLTYTLPISSFENLSITDFPPLPVLQVNPTGPAGDTYTFVRGAPTYQPYEIALAPDDTFFSTFPGFGNLANSATNGPGNISTDVLTNSVTANFGNFEDPLRRSTTISLLLTLQVGSDAFATDLFLTNQLRVFEASTNNGNTTVEDIRPFVLVVPNVTVDKGVVADSRNGNAPYSNLGNLGISFTGLGSTSNFSVTGGNIAFANQADAIGAQNAVTALDAGDRVRFAIVAQNTGRGDAYDVIISDVLPSGYSAPDSAANFAANANLTVRRGNGASLGSGQLVDQLVRVATTGNIALSGAQFIDGVSVGTGALVLVKDQTGDVGEGIYLANSAGAWTFIGGSADDTVGVLGGATNRNTAFEGNSSGAWSNLGNTTAYFYSYDPVSRTFRVSPNDNFDNPSPGDTAETLDNRLGGISRGSSGNGANIVPVTDGTNSLIITYDLTLNSVPPPSGPGNLTTVRANEQLINTAQIDRLGSSEGGPDISPHPTDPATVIVLSPGISKTLVTTGANYAGNNQANQATIGETVTYSITVSFPEGITPGARIIDTLDPGLAFVTLDSISVSSSGTGALTSSLGSGAGNFAFLNNVGNGTGNTAITNSGQTITFNLGNITNTDTSNGAIESITITYTTVVLNTTNNQDAQTRTNLANVTFTGGNTGNVSAANITIVEPTLAETKQVQNVSNGGLLGNRTAADAGDVVRYVITLNNSGGPTGFDITLNDPIPAALGNLTIISANSTANVFLNGSNTPFSHTGNGVFTLGGAGNTVQLSAGNNIDIQAGGTITIIVEGTYSGATALDVVNSSTLTWSSLDGNVANVSTFNAASSERNGADGNLGTGVLNDYRLVANATIESPILINKTIVATSESTTTGSNVAVGEIVRYRLVTSIPEGNTVNFQIQEDLGNGLAFLNDGSARYAFISTGGNVISSGNVGTIVGLGTPSVGSGGIDGNEALISGNTLTSAAITGNFNSSSLSTAFNGAGLGNVTLLAEGQDVFFRLGNITNADNDSDNEYIVIEFNALVLNDNTPPPGSNGVQGGQLLTNRYTVLLDTDGDSVPGYVSARVDTITNGVIDVGDLTVNAIDPDNDAATPTNTPGFTPFVFVTVREPNLVVTKAISSGTGDAGDTRTYTITITNSGPNAAEAFDLVLTDVLPAGVTFAGNLSTTGDGPIAGNATEAGGTITLNAPGNTTDGFDQGESITITFDVTLANSVAPNQTITNRANLTYTGLPGNGTPGNPTGSVTPGNSGAFNGERNGSNGPGNDTVLNNYATSALANITIPTGNISKSLFATDLAQTAGGNVALGERVTYALLVTLPEGATPSSTIVDQLPNGMIYVANSARRVTDAANSGGLLTADFNGTVSLSENSGPFGNGADPVFSLSNLTIAGDNLGNNNSFLILFDAIVLGNDTGTNHGLNGNQNTLVNVANLTIPSVPLLTTGNVSLTVVEPQLQIDKSIPSNVTVYDAGNGANGTPNTITYQIVISHTANSTAPAFDLTIDDLVPAGLTYVANSAVVVSGNASIVDNTSNLTVSSPELGLGGNITLQFQAYINASVPPGNSVVNTANVTYDTYSGNRTEQRVEPTVNDTATVSVFTNSIAGQIYYDANNNGLRDGNEPLILGNVTVQLSGTDHLGNPVTANITTANGTYNFTGLRPGAYAVHELTQPGGYLDGKDAPGAGNLFGGTSTLGGNDGDTIANASIGLGGNKSGINYNFGELLPASLGNFVWEDQNGNGRQDGNEPGIGNITVTLTGTNDLGASVSANLVTDANGAYTFGGLRPGNYAVSFGNTAGNITYAYTVQNSPVANGATNSDGNQTTGNTATIPLVAGANNPNLDQGLYRPVTIGDLVWYDIDGNGTQNGNEPGIPGANVTVTWYGPDGQPGGGDDANYTTVTDGNGVYQIANLPPGNYGSSVTNIPANLTIPTFSQGNGTGNFTLTSGANRTDIDFGFRGTVSLGNFVWEDRNADGIQQGNEPGIANATVTLTWFGFDGNEATTADNIEYTTTTGNTGLYQFANLPTGSFRANFAVPTGFERRSPGNAGNDTTLDSNANSTGFTGVITLANAGDSDQTIDAGFYLLASIGDLVWNDANGDGIRQGNEAGIGGVTVRLIDGNGTVIGNTTTDGNGAYNFANLTPGTYAVEVVAPANFTFTQTNIGNDTTDSDVPQVIQPVPQPVSRTANYTLISGENNTTVDAGLYRGGNLGDLVWYDVNRDGSSTGEPGLGNVTLQLLNGAGTVIGNTTTDGNGAYSFNNLPAGNYTVRVTGNLPAGLTNPTYDLDGVGTANIANATLGVGEANGTVDFGYGGTGSLGNFVWDDLNADGIQQANEPGIANATVTLTWFGFNGIEGDSDDITYPAVQTDGNGAYQFGNLPTGVTTGQFRANFALPTSYQRSPANAGNDAALDSNANSAGLTGAITLANAGASDQSIDAGFYRFASIGDFVFVDNNGNGRQDSGEVGLGNVSVHLLAGNGTELANTTTLANGFYTFGNLVPGAYSIRFDAPATYQFTFPDVNGNGNDAIDSDAHRTTGLTGNYTLISGEYNQTVDAGLFQPVTIGDQVWYDTNGDGLFNGTANLPEPSLANVTVRLYYDSDLDGNITDAEANTPIATQLTGVNGTYSFGNLPPGVYRVDVDTGNLPLQNLANTTATVQNPGNAGLMVSNQTDLNRDFGFRGNGSIGDRVFFDINNNGTFDAGEGLGNVTVQLTGDLNGDGSNETLTTTTGNDGFYQFGNLRTSDGNGVPYTVNVVTSTLPSGANSPLTNTVDPDGGNNSVANLALTTANFSNQNQDFGYRDPNAGAIGDEIFLDLNNNGLYDPGEGIGNVTVTLSANIDGVGAPEVFNLQTNANGAYLFTGLPVFDPQGNPIQYQVVVNPANLPPGVVNTTDPNGGNDSQSTLFLNGNLGANRLDQDFGYRANSSLAGFVYVDSSNDGNRAGPPSEPGIGNVTLTLTSTINGSNFTTTAQTDANGAYSFTGLPAGNWTITQTQPPNFADGLDRAGTINGNTVGAAGNDVISNITLNLGEQGVEYNFGELGADVRIIKSVSQETQYIGLDVTYEFIINNLGPSTAVGVVVTDPFPAGLRFVTAFAPTQGTVTYASGIVTWNVGDMLNGAQERLQVVARVVLPGNWVNSASAASVSIDPFLSNNLDPAGLNAQYLPPGLITKRNFLTTSQLPPLPETFTISAADTTPSQSAGQQQLSAAAVTTEASFTPWTPLDGFVKQIELATNAAGQLQVFGIGGDNALWYKVQDVDNDPIHFGPWTSLGGYVKSFTVGQNAGGALQVFAIGGDDAAWTNLEVGGQFTSGGWASLGGFVKQLAVERDAANRLELFGIGGDNALWVNVQDVGVDFTGWQSLGGFVTQVDAARNADGTLQVIAIGGDNAAWTRKQTAPGSGGYNDWQSLGGFVKQVLWAANADGTLQVFAIGGDNAAWTRKQNTASTDQPALFTTWQSLGGYVKQLSAGRFPDDTLGLFAIGGDNAAYLRRQALPGASTAADFDPYESFGGFVKQLAVGANGDTGAVGLFAIGGDNALWTRGQIVSPLLLDAAPTGAPGERLSSAALTDAVAEAIRRWAATGLSDAQVAWLRGLDYRSADLGDARLGLYTPGQVLIDDDAAGYGWFSDPTPMLDEEFDASGTALTTAARSRADLLSVVMHELGHALGQAHAQEGWMADTLALGTRR